MFNNNMKKLLAICSAVLFVLPAFAQQNYTGTVTDAFGDPFMGAVVQIQETKAAAVTDAAGAFSIKASKGQTMEVSCLGMKTVTMQVPENGPISVVLHEDYESLEETVIVGYGVTKKRDLAGSVSSIKTEEIKPGVITNTEDLIKGRAAGVYVQQNSSAPGASVNIRIRGAASIGSNNNPLYVIDGVLSSPGNMLAPEDVESIEILKDAASTAIYGANGANGVVIITTKKGHANSFSVNYSYNLSAKALNNTIELMDAQDYMGYEMRIWEDAGGFGAAPYTDAQLAYKGAGTNWLTEMAKVGLTQTHAVTMAGGTEKVKAAASFNYHNNDGTLPSNSFKRLNGRVNVDYTPVKWLTAGMSANITRSDTQQLSTDTANATENAMYMLFTMSPLSKNDDSGLDWIGRMDWSDYVSKYFRHSDNHYKGTSSTITGYAEFKPFDCLSIRGQYSTSSWSGTYQRYFSRETNIGEGKSGIADWSDDFSLYRQVDGVLTYHDTFADKHDLKIIAGTSWNSDQSEWLSTEASHFGTDAFRFYNMGAAGLYESIGSGRTDHTSLSFFGRVEYVLSNKYIFNASFRADGASNFGKSNKWGYFPGVSAAWQLGNEDFMSWAKPVLSSLKLRASWGQTGNDGIGCYQSLKTYGNEKAYMGYNNIVTALYLTNPGNDSLKWETTTQTDLGFDATLWGGKVEITADYYHKLTTDLLNGITISYSKVGIGSTIGNNGAVSNQGAELFVKWHILDKKGFTWSTNFAFSYNKSRIVDINQESYVTVRPQGAYEYNEYIKLAKDYPLGALYGYKCIGILQEGETYEPQPKAQPGDYIFEDINGDGQIDLDDRTHLGTGVPPVTIGWGHNFRFGNFDATIFFDASLGGSLFNLSKVVLEDKNRTMDCLQRWTKAHPSDVMGRSIWEKTTDYQYGSYVNSRFIERSDYLRLSNIEIGYNIPAKKISDGKLIKAARVFIGAQKLFTLTNYSGLDPEISSGGSGDTVQGLDWAAYPSYRTFNCGVNVTF